MKNSWVRALEFRDKRSFRVLIVSDYIVNPGRYGADLSIKKLFERIEERGFGIIKMPPIHLDQKKVEPWIVSAADQIQEYSNRGFKIAVLCLSFLQDGGVWMSRLRDELKERGIDSFKFETISEEEIQKGTAVDKIEQLW